MIYTCTLNPSVDFIIEMDSFEIGKLNRTKNVMKYPGGKGINVSRVLKRLGVDNVALGFIGGLTGDFITHELEKEQIAYDFVNITGETRINLKLKSDQETEINSQGPSISTEQQARLLEKMQNLRENDYLILAGNIPSSLPANFYHSILKRLMEKKVKIIVDTSGTALKELISCQPFLIKPNHHELGDLFHTTLTSLDDIITYGKQLVSMGIENVIVSMAEKGALFFNKQMTLFANAPKGDVKSSVGAGDSMIAGFLAIYAKEKNVEKAFQYSVAAGSATAFSPNLCTRSQVEQLVQKIQITHL
ncbi:1-phosphofructokinase [Thermoflavimicrobium dichotomicum]|uniref:Tagatose-6-phosphate kinase n=1 Tax=Thermoflavimicrobium dichotomicum TaxID=46223 RepID=A0A1I3PTH8_9BACL|nr:1-phosphofructokinase [Thermoflavimicrobium dichotomicum]SFJ24779.1 1-phosphofructokinase [Thermoflavimicrobium dichotomicum]